ncbi:MAG: hypothetical protein OXE99_13750 [Cellvibrionales bacterium]|nr:hypothetical protein [Cellvibrionales bacterium]
MTALSIAENRFFSLVSLTLVLAISACSEKKDKKTTQQSQEEAFLQALEEENIKPVFIEEAKFYQSANKTRQITEVPNYQLPEINKDKFVPFPETYDPFAIIFLDTNAGVQTNWSIHYTLDYDKDKGEWIRLSDIDNGTYINYQQTRFGGQQPKWFKVYVNVSGGSSKTHYINALKQKKDVYVIVGGSTLIDDSISQANIIDEHCKEPEKYTALKDTSADDAGKTDKDDQVIAEKDRYNIDNTKWNKCLHIEYNKLVFSDSDFSTTSKTPGEKINNPVKDEKESMPRHQDLNI